MKANARRGVSPGDSPSSDPYVIGRQLGSEGRDKTVYEAHLATTRPAVALAQFKTRSTRVQQALRCGSGHVKSTAKIRVEANFQRRAAAVGLSPALLEVDLERSRLVMELLPGGTLLHLARSQGGSLTMAQQRRIVDLLKRLGTDARMVHNDCGNPANFLADEDGRLFVIDFGMAKDLGTTHPHANLHAIRHLLFDAQQGMITHGFLTQPPALLIREYEAFLDALANAPNPAAAAASGPSRAAEAPLDDDDDEEEEEEAPYRSLRKAPEAAVAVAPNADVVPRMRRRRSPPASAILVGYTPNEDGEGGGRKEEAARARADHKEADERGHRCRAAQMLVASLALVILGGSIAYEVADYLTLIDIVRRHLEGTTDS
jgi:hypothetical protein